MTYKLKNSIPFIVIFVLFVGILYVVLPSFSVKELSVTYPFDGTLFPPDIAPPTVLWDDKSGADTWTIRIEFQDTNDPLEIQTTLMKWTPERDMWESIKKRSLKKTANVTIHGFKKRFGLKKIMSKKEFSITTSGDEVGAPIFFRSVTLPFEYAINNVETIKWCLGDISSEEPPRVVLENLPVCGNCHSFSVNGKYLGMDVDYANDKGSYIIAEISKNISFTNDKIITWSDFRREDREPTFGLLSQVSPDGRYTVSTVKDRSVFVPVDDPYYSQLFFPLKGILVYYDLKTDSFQALHGADDKRYVQSNPSWSPDGEYIIFAKSKVGELKKVGNQVLLTRQQCEKFLTGGEKFKFDLYRIPFNDGKGGEAKSIEGASNNGMSNYFAKYSPDGKWIVFCKAESFMLLQPDSKLYIMPAGGGTPREMKCNTDQMNSWHSWSPNSRWLVFSSKIFTPYTQLFLTHIDEDGNDSPPVLMSRFTPPDRAANIPEFVNIKFNDLIEIHEEFVDHYSFAKKAGQLFDQGRYTESEKYLRKSIELKPDYAEAHKNFGYLLTQLRRFDEAEKEWEIALQLDPDDPLINLNMGSIYLGRNEYGKAQKSFETSIELDEYCVPAHIGLGIVLLSEGDIDGAHEKFKTAVNINPEYDDAHYRLGIVFLRKKEYVNAEKAFRIAIKLNPKNENAYLGLAKVLALDEKTIPEAISIYNEAMALTSSNVQEHIVLGNIYLKQGDRDSAIKEFDKLLKINPDSPSLRMYVNQLKHQKND